MSKSASQRSINLDAEGEGSVQDKAVTPPASATASAAATIATDPIPGASADNPNPPETKKKTPSNRCQVCRKKVGLTGFECRCGGLFCFQHRYSDKHECSFDYRKLGAEEIRKNNPVVVGEKIQKI